MNARREAESGPSPSKRSPPLETWPPHPRTRNLLKHRRLLPDVGQANDDDRRAGGPDDQRSLLSDVRSSQNGIPLTNGPSHAAIPQTMESTRALRREARKWSSPATTAPRAQPYAAINGISPWVLPNACGEHRGANSIEPPSWDQLRQRLHSSVTESGAGTSP